MFFKRQSKFNTGAYSKKNNLLNKGFGLVKILVGASIICLSLLLIINLEINISKLGFSATPKVQAGLLVEEGYTAVKNIRNISWQKISSLNNNTPYGLSWNQNNGSWEATTSEVLIDGEFDRTITFYAVNRDAVTFDIVANGGVPDLGTRKFVVSVSWNDNGVTTARTMTSYIHNIFNK